jgi:hypothetical protein
MNGFDGKTEQGGKLDIFDPQRTHDPQSNIPQMAPQALPQET